MSMGLITEVHLVTSLKITLLGLSWMVLTLNTLVRLKGKNVKLEINYFNDYSF